MTDPRITAALDNLDKANAIVTWGVDSRVSVQHAAEIEIFESFPVLVAILREVQAVCNAIESDAASEDFPSWEARQTAEVIYGHLTRALAPLAELERED